MLAEAPRGANRMPVRSPARFEAWYARLLLGEAVPAAPALRRAIAIHANNAMVAACDALASNFPVVRAMLGEDAFAGLALRHVMAHPPVDPRLCLYGSRLALTLAQVAELTPWPWLPDMARLEWCMVEALFAADPPARLRRLTLGRSWPLAPATRWLVSEWPVVSLWQAHQPGADWPEDFPRRAELALVTRPHGQVMVTALPADALTLLEALRQRTPLARLGPESLAQLPALAATGALVPAIGDE
ncbi:HvfC/BufC N-terminal domain-containing protein [Sandarakinorhabdus oryzae]|uniref:HvfC/BufC N-terminal domain-containing protein n=1 Tax=Sandarakinorhabdus oryzae TaxID=2675220 RepID=UPI0018CC0022|nr:DNA-binding domain-containing protein [Sandarakinorhabdus oryzae]